MARSYSTYRAIPKEPPPGMLDLGLKARGVFMTLYMTCDKWGRFEAGSYSLRAATHVYVDDPARYLLELSEAGLVRCYEVDGCRFGEIVDYDAHLTSDMVRHRDGGTDVPLPDPTSGSPWTPAVRERYARGTREVREPDTGGTREVRERYARGTREVLPRGEERRGDLSSYSEHEGEIARVAETVPPVVAMWRSAFNDRYMRSIATHGRDSVVGYRPVRDWTERAMPRLIRIAGNQDGMIWLEDFWTDRDEHSLPDGAELMAILADRAENQ